MDASDDGGIKVAEVVTAFLTHKGKVLVLQRSARVGTYQHRWAGVSGYLEGRDPLEQAYREIREEVGLARAQLRLLRAGAPLRVEDEGSNRLWIVHPFLLEVKRPDLIRLDWENMAMRWVAPGVVKTLATVPALDVALESVLPVVDDWIRRRVQKIAADRRRGAAELAGEALKALGSACRRGRAATVDELALKVWMTAALLANCRPTMAAIRNSCLRFIDDFFAGLDETPGLRAARDIGAQITARLLAARATLVQRQVAAARPLLRDCRQVVTLSYSSTVEAILAEALPAGCRVTIAEASPLKEGRRLFLGLRSRRLTPELITDAQLGLAIRGADLVLVGADAILSDLAVVNKAGTYLAALAAAHQRVPFYVAADSYKADAYQDAQHCNLEPRPGEEVWRRHPESCRNLTFDITPAELVTGVICEQGILPIREVDSQVQRWRRLADSYGLTPAPAR